jgi:DNA-directed RNA polymerase specialized sigma24 family protein
MTRSVPADRPDPSSAAYAAELHRHAVRLLAIRHREVSYLDIDDVAQDVVVTFFGDPGSVMTRYPNPVAYASASVGSRLEDWRRRERAQRGEGARLTTDAGGQPCVKRRFEPLDDLDLDRGLGGVDEASLVAGRLHAEELLATLEPREAALVRAVDIDGATVTEACTALGLTRSHASRIRTAALERLGDELGGACAC